MIKVYELKMNLDNKTKPNVVLLPVRFYC